MQKTVSKIYLNHIRENAKIFSAITKKPVCAVVKADAYGHGAEEVALALTGEVGLFAVSLIDEAVAIRLAVCGKDILVLTPPLSEGEMYTGAVNGFILTVADLATAHQITKFTQKTGLPVRVHLKSNTGMNRYGMNLQTLGRACKALSESKLVRVEGVYSHLRATNATIAEKQRLEFLRAERICKGYFPWIQSHLSATYGALLGEKFVFDFTRIGIGLYGYLPDGARDTLYTPTLKKGMEVFAYIAGNRVFTGGGAGYGEEDFARKGERLSVLRVGYADGFLRKRDNGLVGANENANNLCMDACLRFGLYKKGGLTPIMTDAKQTARQTGTISYEVLCSATRRSQRIYIRE